MTAGRATLISADELARHLHDPDWAVVDCRFVLRDPAAGRAAYLASHIPGAVYAHLDDDLSGPIIRGRTGRHPLPAVETFAGKLSRWGVDGGVRVVAYDDAGGASAAARLWWMLGWLGHDRVVLLDGGWAEWRRRGLPVQPGEEARVPRRFVPRVNPDLVADAALVERMRRDPAWRLLDARAVERYRGQNETIDPVAGRIPGAHSMPFAENLDPEGRFRPPGELRNRYLAVTGGVPAGQVVCYCGSGVTAAHNVFAMVHAGLGQPKLYAGSWSDWILDPRRPVAVD